MSACHPAADLAETLDGHRTAVQALRPSAQGRLRGHRDAVPGQQVLERHARHHGADRRGCGPAPAQRREVLLGRAHVRPGQEPARVRQRSDLRTEPRHQGGPARAVRRIPAHARLGAADPLAQRGELVGHRARQHRHLGHADVWRQPRPAGRQRRPGQVEYHEPRHRAEFDDLCTAIASRHVTIMTARSAVGRPRYPERPGQVWNRGRAVPACGTPAGHGPTVRPAASGNRLHSVSVRL